MSLEQDFLKMITEQINHEFIKDVDVIKALVIKMHENDQAKIKNFEGMVKRTRDLIRMYNEMIELCGHSICNRALKLQWILFKHQALTILGEEDPRDYWKEDKPFWDKEGVDIKDDD